MISLEVIIVTNIYTYGGLNVMVVCLLTKNNSSTRILPAM